MSEAQRMQNEMNGLVEIYRLKGELLELRDERDRLQRALEKVRDVIRGIDDPEAYLPYDVYELAGVAEAALTPAGGGKDGLSSIPK